MRGSTRFSVPMLRLRQALRNRTLSDTSSDARLPDHVRIAIRRQEERAEILIGWVQLGLVAIWSILYALTPKAVDADRAMLEPVPIALAGYAVFTILRLVLARRRALPNWMVDLSMIVDMALLMTLIWSFHIQYQQPASFYLKAPTLLYVFIFIALRALRFDPRFVLVAGVVAALGWGVLVLYAIAANPVGDMITRNYVAYLTGNKILLGAEFDKIITILIVTGVLTVALARGRRLLISAVAEEAAARELSRFFAPEIARRITRSADHIRAGQGEIRDAAILMIDMRGFTRIAASVPPDAAIGLLAEYQARVVPAIGRHCGSIDKFMGDGIMATFGAAEPSDRYAADALRAIEDVLATVDAWNAERTARGEPPVAVNAAAATGRIIFGAVGDATRLEYTVIGDAVNLAAKLEKHNKIEGGAAIAAAEALVIAHAQGYRPGRVVEERPRRMVQGVDQPLDLVVFTSAAPPIGPEAAPRPSSVAGGSTRR